MRNEIVFWGESSVSIVLGFAVWLFTVIFGFGILTSQMNFLNLVVGLGLLLGAIYLLLEKFIFTVRFTKEKVLVRYLLKSKSFDTKNILEIYKNREGSLMVDIYVMRYHDQRGNTKKATFHCSNKELEKLYIFLIECGVERRKLRSTYK
jgi:hypothetical protein